MLWEMGVRLPCAHHQVWMFAPHPLPSSLSHVGCVRQVLSCAGSVSVSDSCSSTMLRRDHRLNKGSLLDKSSLPPKVAINRVMSIFKTVRTGFSLLSVFLLFHELSLNIFRALMSSSLILISSHCCFKQ